MLEFLGEIEKVAADLYPYRWPITLAAGAVAVALGAVAWRSGWLAVLWRRRVLTAVITVPMLAVALPVGWYALSPLWERTRLDEASPLAVATPMLTPEAAPTASAAGDASPGPSGREGMFMPRVTHQGMFAGADDFHFGRGDALLIETSPGMYMLRFEDFSVRNGPDLFVYLTNDPDDVSGGVNLGDLKATDGNFNYDVPAGVDPGSYRYAIVWCREFAVLFASAPLEITV
jgi:hypothetical protein